jgi:hypothetical protein
LAKARRTSSRAHATNSKFVHLPFRLPQLTRAQAVEFLRRQEERLLAPTTAGDAADLQLMPLCFLLWLYFSWLVTLSASLVTADLGRATGQQGRPARSGVKARLVRTRG